MTARYIGFFDLTNEESLPAETRKPLHLFNLLRALGEHEIGATLTKDELSSFIVVPESLTKGNEI